MIWIELSTRADAEAVEAVSELFARLGYGGVAIEEPLTDSVEPDRVDVDASQPFTVKTYLPEDEQSGDKIGRAEEALWHLSQLRLIEPLRVARVAEEDWAETWKEFFFVQRVGERLIIKPSWREYSPESGQVVVELDPGMAFGTGLHPSTRMCLQACERLVRPGTRVLDVGTGSAILAIAAAGLGADSVIALDVDPVAVEVARKNVAMNGLEDRIQVLHGSLERLAADQVAFDLVLANIIASVIVELAPALASQVAPGGVLVASGIIAEREEWVRSTLESVGLGVRETVCEGDWRAMVCERGRA